MPSILQYYGEVKILKRYLSCSLTLTSNSLIIQDLNDNLYLAPKTDIFTIGMLLLHLASLEPLDYLYDYNTYSLNFAEIQNKIKKLKYSEFFK